MALVHDLLSSNLPAKRRKSSRGWITCNAVCCHHRGHNQDTRFRGNIMFSPDGAIAYNCYNCGFKTVYTGASLSKNFESLMTWFGVPYEDIKRVKLELLSQKMDGNQPGVQHNSVYVLNDFNEIKLPDGAKPIEQLLETEQSDDFLRAVDYLYNRGEPILTGWKYYWSAETKWDLNKRVIIPFYHKGKVVGWTARYIGTPPKGTSRYFNSEFQLGYVFNCDHLYRTNRKYVIVVEGPFDAIAIDGVATLGSELSKEQLAWLNSTDTEKIVLPDRQRKNQGLIDIAVENNWYVSFPDWEADIKDAADATNRYGKLFTLKTVIDSKTKNTLEINIKRRMFKE